MHRIYFSRCEINSIVLRFMEVVNRLLIGRTIFPSCAPVDFNLIGPMGASGDQVVFQTRRHLYASAHLCPAVSTRRLDSYLYPYQN